MFYKKAQKLTKNLGYFHVNTFCQKHVKIAQSDQTGLLARVSHGWLDFASTIFFGFHPRSSLVQSLKNDQSTLS